MIKLIVLGAPGAGKGTQSRLLSEHYKVPNISSGDLLRSEIENKTEIGLAINETVSHGKLIDDEVIKNIMINRLSNEDCKNGFILDGYPRTVKQSMELESFAGKVNKAVYVDVKDEVIVERMSGRLTCEVCKKMYNIHYYPPKKQGVCDECGGKLVQREDDKAKTVLDRLALFHKLVGPILEYYEKKNMLIKVDGTADIDNITNCLIREIDK